jgi:hypothetical protein
MTRPHIPENHTSLFNSPAVMPMPPRDPIDDDDDDEDEDEDDDDEEQYEEKEPPIVREPDPDE